VSVDKMIAEAEKTLGWSDENNTVKTPVHTWYEAKFGVPDRNKFAWDWCDGWITYVAHKSGNERAVRCSSGMSYTLSHVQAFKANGEWHTGAAGIAKGDVVFFDWGSGIEHVGLVLGVKASGRIHTIEGNTLNTVAYREREATNVAGYGRPKYTTTPPTTGGGTTVPTTYTPPPFPTGLRPGSASPSAKPLQRALKAAGYMNKSIPEADNYGPNTEASVAAFYRANQSLSSGGGYDPIIGPKGWAELHREAARTTAAASSTSTPTA
jgi:hypothetical protein